MDYAIRTRDLNRKSNPLRAPNGTKKGIRKREIIPRRDAVVCYLRKDGKERLFQCDECGKRFTRQGGLHLHKKIHSDIRFECDKCGKKFVQKSQLTVHMKVHNNQKDFVCNICNKSFVQKTGLEIHIRYHTDERPYGCDDCPMRFHQIPALQRHQLATGSKSFLLISRLILSQNFRLEKFLGSTVDPYLGRPLPR